MAQVDAKVFVRTVAKTHAAIAAGEIAAEDGADMVAKELNLKNSSQVNTRIQSLTKKGLKGVAEFQGKKRGRKLNVDELNDIAAEFANEENAEAAA